HARLLDAREGDADRLDRQRDPRSDPRTLATRAPAPAPQTRLTLILTPYIYSARGRLHEAGHAAADGAVDRGQRDGPARLRGARRRRRLGARSHDGPHPPRDLA